MKLFSLPFVAITEVVKMLELDERIHLSLASRNSLEVLHRAHHANQQFNILMINNVLTDLSSNVSTCEIQGLYEIWRDFKNCQSDHKKMTIRILKHLTYLFKNPSISLSYHRIDGGIEEIVTLIKNLGLRVEDVEVQACNLQLSRYIFRKLSPARWKVTHSDRNPYIFVPPAFKVGILSANLTANTRFAFKIQWTKVPSLTKNIINIIKDEPPKTVIPNEFFNVFVANANNYVSLSMLSLVDPNQNYFLRQSAVFAGDTFGTNFVGTLETITSSGYSLTTPFNRLSVYTFGLSNIFNYPLYMAQDLQNLRKYSEFRGANCPKSGYCKSTWDGIYFDKMVVTSYNGTETITTFAEVFDRDTCVNVYENRDSNSTWIAQLKRRSLEEGGVWKKAEFGRRRSLEEGGVWKKAEFGRRRCLEEGGVWKKAEFGRRRSLEEGGVWKKAEFGRRRSLEEGGVWKKAEFGRRRSLEEGGVWKKAEFGRRRSLEEGGVWKKAVLQFSTYRSDNCLQQLPLKVNGNLKFYQYFGQRKMTICPRSLSTFLFLYTLLFSRHSSVGRDTLIHSFILHSLPDHRWTPLPIRYVFPGLENFLEGRTLIFFNFVLIFILYFATTCGKSEEPSDYEDASDFDVSDDASDYNGSDDAPNYNDYEFDDYDVISEQPVSPIRTDARPESVEVQDEENAIRVEQRNRAICHGFLKAIKVLCGIITVENQSNSIDFLELARKIHIFLANEEAGRSYLPKEVFLALFHRFLDASAEKRTTNCLNTKDFLDQAGYQFGKVPFIAHDMVEVLYERLAGVGASSLTSVDAIHRVFADVSSVFIIGEAPCTSRSGAKRHKKFIKSMLKKHFETSKESSQKSAEGSKASQKSSNDGPEPKKQKEAAEDSDPDDPEQSEQRNSRKWHLDRPLIVVLSQTGHSQRWKESMLAIMEEAQKNDLTFETREEAIQHLNFQYYRMRNAYSKVMAAPETFSVRPTDYN
ncbi:unnamed protein product [Caenorhabditis brenneri]